jgi:phage shock protein E
MKVKLLIILLMFVVGFAATATAVSAASEIPRITKEDAKGKIDDPNVVFLDVRTGSDWRASAFKIKGAVYEEQGKFEEWAKNYDKNKTYFVYCA